MTNQTSMLHIKMKALCILLVLAFTSFTIKLSAQIAAQQVQESFQKTGLSNQYSRLFFNQQDIERVKALYKQQDPIVKIAYAALEEKAQEVLKEPIQAYALDAAKLRIPSIHNFASQLPSLVMMYQFTGNQAYADRAWAQLEKFIDYPDWGANRHFLDAGIGAFNFALAYDGLHDYLSAEQKSKLKAAVMKHVLMPAKIQMEKRTWWHTAHHNWNGICNGGIIMAALAMFEDDPQLMSHITSLAANALPYYINSFEPDGQSEEGLMYWSYGLMYTTIALESMQRVLGTTYALDEAPGFKKTGWFPLYVSGPVTSLSIGDDPLKDKRSTTFFWFAKRYQDKALAKLHYDLCLENKQVTWMDMLYYQPDMVNGPSPLAALPTDNYIRGIELMSLRENWEAKGLYIAMHGGKNDANHGHLDAGTFDIQGLGEVWAYGDLGRDNYTFPGYFSKTTLPDYLDTPSEPKEAGRWHFYRLRAEGKNCLVFNPDYLPDQNPTGEATLLKQKSDKTKGFYTLNLSNCYSKDVTSYHRGIKLDRLHQVMTVRDEFNAKTKSDLWWSMHTKAKIEISKDGKTAILSIGKKKMYAQINTSLNAKFEVLPASYLPGRTFSLTQNSANEGFKKLAIRLADVKEGAIQVDFSPNKAKVQTQNQSLNQW